MYSIFSKSEKKYIFENLSERELMSVVEKLVIENGDENYSVLGIADAIEYFEYSIDYVLLAKTF